MKNYLKGTIFSGLLLLSFACNKKENHQSKQQNNTTENFRVDSLSLSDSKKVFDSVTVDYYSRLLVFPDLKDKTLLDSIYFDKKGLADFSAKGLTDNFTKETKAYYDFVNKNRKNADIHYKQTWEYASDMKMKSYENGYLHIQYYKKETEGKTRGTADYTEKVFDIQNNKKVELTDITTASKEKLSTILQENFDKNDKKIKFADLTVKKIVPNNNFYFDKNNLYFHYNMNVFMPGYPMGDIVVAVSWDKLEGQINPAFKERMKIN
ncbi:RsiV family protein [Chryseobacterium daeguense]|uniref:RsiV family protein n=1 Tax=Chryseobacterium daeguense TaxID=412438 RepID=UPI000422B593|nr:DUF3298 domain-containing protein [Chryseobacterium daeguense]